MLSLFETAYGTVLVAELSGDKLLYTLGALATRFRILPVLTGAALAFVLKMLAAVLLGQILAELPPRVRHHRLFTLRRCRRSWSRRAHDRATPRAPRSAPL
jgi:putative Ca2+/H+ antiporter (TMEM165/GDT1 family)